MRSTSLAAVLLLAACSGAGNGLSGDAAISTATWVEVSLADGAVAAVPAPDARTLASDRWRTRHVLFRRIPVATVSADGSLLPGRGEVEDVATAGSDGRCFLAVFELTSAQWGLLTGDGGGDQRPLAGVPAEEVAAVLAGTCLQRLHLDLPDAGLWQVACSAGRSTLFCWGDGSGDEAADGYACRLPRNGTVPTGPRTVGSLQANAWGLFDMHGNVWEMARRGADFQARGGAWDSPILQCRSANVVELPGDLAVPDVGVRLALRP